MRVRAAVSAVIVAVLLGPADVATATQDLDSGLSLTFEVKRLPTPTGWSSTAQAINNVGAAVGQRGQRAVLWEGDSATVLGALENDTSSIAYGVNDRSTVVGTSIGTDSGGEPTFRAFRWSPADGISALGSLGGERSEARDVNLLGTAVGSAATRSKALHAFRAAPGLPMVDLGTIDGFPNSEALAINGFGEAVGFASDNEGNRRAFVHTAGTMSALPLPEGSRSVAYDINDAGQVVGSSTTTDGAEHAFVWSATAGLKDLGALSSGDELSINPAGDVLTSSGRLWRDGDWLDLSVLLSGAEPSWQLLSAFDFNASGQVVGQGRQEFGRHNVAIMLVPSATQQPAGQ